MPDREGRGLVLVPGVREVSMEDREKPVVSLDGVDGNIFSVFGAVTRALRREGMYDKAEEAKARLFQCRSYDAALQLALEYVDFE